MNLSFLAASQLDVLEKRRSLYLLYNLICQAVDLSILTWGIHELCMYVKD